jgi:putative transposase
MQLRKGFLYHMYNQGNNRNRVFFKKDNYLFFLRKVKTYILPYADIIAWCLMPNHFHFMVLVNYARLPERGGATSSRTPTKTVSLNHSIGILLASYTRAINKQNNTSGSLFRQKTKAE